MVVCGTDGAGAWARSCAGEGIALAIVKPAAVLSTNFLREILLIGYRFYARWWTRSMRLARLSRGRSPVIE